MGQHNAYVWHTLQNNNPGTQSNLVSPWLSLIMIKLKYYLLIEFSISNKIELLRISIQNQGGSANNLPTQQLSSQDPSDVQSNQVTLIYSSLIYFNIQN